MGKINNAPWYENSAIVMILCVVFFPIGMYGLWMNKTLPLWFKIAISSILGLAILIRIIFAFMP